MQETQVQSLGWEDPLEKEIATHFSILAWEIPCPLHLWAGTWRSEPSFSGLAEPPAAESAVMVVKPAPQTLPQTSSSQILREEAGTSQLQTRQETILKRTFKKC